MEDNDVAEAASNQIQRENCLTGKKTFLFVTIGIALAIMLSPMNKADVLVVMMGVLSGATFSIAKEYHSGQAPASDRKALALMSWIMFAIFCRAWRPSLQRRILTVPIILTFLFLVYTARGKIKKFLD